MTKGLPYPKGGVCVALGDVLAWYLSEEEIEKGLNPRYFLPRRKRVSFPDGSDCVRPNEGAMK